VLHWVGRWCWTYDPRERVTRLPFDPFPKQAEFLLWLAERERLQEGGLVEKSRDMGASWLCCAYAMHGWLFRPGYQVGFGSRKLEYVDERGDPKCIFEKLRLLLENLPGWMYPRGFRWNEHSCHAKLLNPETGASVTGEGGDNIGRGGRSSVYFLDEAAFVERPALVDRALSQTTRVRVDVSTPNGPGNGFAEKRFSGRLPVFTFHWRDDPRKGEAWYARERARLDPVTVAQEIDIDYAASVEGITVPAPWVRAAVGLALPPGAEAVAGLDIAEEGRDRSVLVCRRGPVVLPPEDWGQCNTTETARRARDKCERLGVTVLRYDSVGVGAGVRGAFASMDPPPAFRPVAVNGGESPTEQRWPDGKTSKERFANLRAESHWLLRVRFEKAYEFREKGVAHPPDEMISIPNHPRLIAELSQTLHHSTETGKIKLESKEDMARRGVKSPDFADALALAFSPAGPYRKLIFGA
jgi:phage terminase large subunit